MEDCCNHEEILTSPAKCEIVKAVRESFGLLNLLCVLNLLYKLEANVSYVALGNMLLNTNNNEKEEMKIIRY